jgi:hypothetical protein
MATTNTITLTSHTQTILYKLELLGQLSDGFWATAKPRNHWKQPCSAVIVIGDVGSITFHPERKYNFASKQLLEYVGDRMLIFAKMSIKYPTLSNTAINLTSMGEWCWADDVAYYTSAKLELANIGIHNYEALQHCLKSLDSIKYTIKDLKRDLKAINAAFENIVH